MSGVSRLKRVIIANALFWKIMNIMLYRNSKEHLEVHSMKFPLLEDGLPPYYMW